VSIVQNKLKETAVSAYYLAAYNTAKHNKLFSESAQLLKIFYQEVHRYVM
jgi:hypothetical protein